MIKSNLFQWIGKKAKKFFGKKYGKKIPTWIALAISWFLIGLWHGGEYHYIFGVGIYMGAIIIMSEILEPCFNYLKKVLKINDKCFSWRLFQVIRTICLFLVGLSFFRASGLRDGLYMWKCALKNFNPWIFFDGSLENLGLTIYDFRVLRISIVAMIFAGLIPNYKGKNMRECISEQNIVFRWMIWITLVLSILVFGKYGPGYDTTEFIYRMF